MEEFHETASTADERGGSQRRLARFSSWFLNGPLSAILFCTCVGVFCTWLPVYLCWSWWPDLDGYATMASAWRSGVKPYRDIVSFSFPGHIYLFYALNFLFGAGKTAPIYAFDAALLAALGGLMMAWSKRLYKSYLPGLMGYLAFLSYYASLDRYLVAQRDWHCAFLAVSGLLLLQTWPWRAGLAASSLAFAVGLSLRPYLVLFLPALIVQILEPGRSSENSTKVVALRLLTWLACFGVFTVVVFSPLILDGVFVDFLRGVSLARPNGPYSTRGLQDRMSSLIHTVGTPGSLVLLAAIVWMTLRRRHRGESFTIVWYVCLLASPLCSVLAPIPHDYLSHPYVLVLCVNVSILTGMVASDLILAVESRLALLLVFVVVFASVPPSKCSIGWSGRFLGEISGGHWPKGAPPGNELDYGWSEYQAATEYLRTKTAPNVLVANLLHRPTGICGETGRLSPFRTEAPSLTWLSMTNIHSPSVFALSLEHAQEAVVIWAPHEGDQLRRSDYCGGGIVDLKEINRTVERLFEPEDRFGNLQVWHRKRPLSSSPANSSDVVTRVR
jgi:hypothetical protein